MKTVINIKADKEIKEQAFKVANEMGLPLSTIVNAFLKQLINERRVTFEAPLVPNQKLKKMMAQANKDVAAGKDLSPAFDDVDKAIKWLNSDKKKCS